MSYVPYGRQNITRDDIDAVVSVLESDFLTQGPVGPRFENALAGYAKARFAKITNSATSALHISCLALGVGPGHLVWTTAVSFVASANCALYCGADVDFVDIDAKTHNISLEALHSKLIEARKTNSRLPTVVIVVHLAGLPVEMAKVAALADEFGFQVIEDASHAIGSMYEGSPIGSCEYSDITVFSFHPVKIVTTGEGGAILTNSLAIARKVELLRSHGITRDLDEMTQTPHGPWYYEQQMLGFNFRMTDIQAALGLSQLQKIDNFIGQRMEIAERYNSLLDDAGIGTPSTIFAPGNRSAWHLYVIRVNEQNLSGSRNQIFERLRANGIGVNLHYIPIYRQPYYAKLGFDSARFPESEAYYREAISLPIYPRLSVEDQTRVVELLKSQSGHQTIF